MSGDQVDEHQLCEIVKETQCLILSASTFVRLKLSWHFEKL